jgi:hypothetical protein
MVLVLRTPSYHAASVGTPIDPGGTTTERLLLPAGGRPSVFDSSLLLLKVTGI